MASLLSRTLLVAGTLAGVLVALPCSAEPQSEPAPAVKVRGFVQTWYTFDTGSTDGFRVRRANLYVQGQLRPEFGYAVMLNPLKAIAPPAIVPDPARPGSFLAQPAGDDRILQDAYVKAGLWGFSLQAGQFKLPLSAEALQSAPELILPRRALFNEAASEIGFQRDLGLQLSGKPLPGLSLTLGLFNGEGQNVGDRNERKDLAGRVTYSPWQPLTLGLSHYQGAWGPQALTRRRDGAQLELAQGPWLFRSELLDGQDDTVHKFGWYALGAWTFLPGWQAAARYEGWNPTGLAAGEERDATLAVNYAYLPGAKVSVGYIRQEKPEGLNHQGLVSWQVYL